MTDAPVVQPPPSRLYSVLATPLEASAAERFTVTAVLCQALSAPVWVVIGGVVSMRTVHVLVGPPLLLVSTARTWKYQTPSALPANEAESVALAALKSSLPIRTPTVLSLSLVTARSS